MSSVLNCMRLNINAKRAWLGWMLLLPLLAAGCAVAPPVQEMSDARQAIKAAREADAENYAPDALHAAESQLQHATEQLDAGHYGEARESALTAKQQAVQARDAAVGATERK